MVLNYQREPIVGESFRATLTEFVGTARLKLFIGPTLVADEECPDPPCHEVIVIPRSAKGKILRLVGEDESGSVETLELTIREVDEAPLMAGA